MRRRAISLFGPIILDFPFAIKTPSSHFMKPSGHPLILTWNNEEGSLTRSFCLLFFSGGRSRQTCFQICHFPKVEPEIVGGVFCR